MPKISPTDYKIQLKIFAKIGFTKIRIKGDHLILEKEDCRRPLVIPKYKEVPVFIIKNNIRSAGITRQDYFELLSQV